MSEIHSDDILRELVDGTIDSLQLRDVQRHKDPGRFPRVRALEQECVTWVDRILVPLQEHLYVVDRSPAPIVKCRCGHEFGDYRENWKDDALVYERNAQDGEVFEGSRGAPPEWVVLREFYCPGCAAQLDVEVVPVGYPFVHNFVPNLDVLPEIEARG